MTKGIRRIAAVFAAGAIVLTQLPAAMPTVSAQNMWDLDFSDNWFNPSSTTTSKEAGTTTQPAATSAQTSATTSTSKKNMWDLDWGEWFNPSNSTAASDTTTAAASTAPNATTAASAATTAAATTASPQQGAVVDTTTMRTTADSTTPPVTTAATTATTVTTTVPAESGAPGIVLPDTPEMPDFSYLGAVGNLSAEQTEFLARSIYLCGVNPDAFPFENEGIGGRRYIDFENVEGLDLFLSDSENRELTKESIRQVYETVLYSRRECILLQKEPSGYNLRGEGNGVPAHYAGLYVNTMGSNLMYTDNYNRAQKQLDDILSLADPDWTDAETALFFHDYIAIHYDYDELAYGYDPNHFPPDIEPEIAERVISSHYAYAMLNNKYTVCQGYAWLYNLLLNECGIESYFVSGFVHNPAYDPLMGDDPVMNPQYLKGHAWNLVKIDGNFYHVCITSDDTGSDRQSNSPNADGQYLGYAGQVGHEHFLVSSSALVATGGFFSQSAPDFDWTTTLGESAFELATDSSLENGFWKAAKSVVLPYNGGWLMKTTPLEFPVDKNKVSYCLYTRQGNDYAPTQLFVEQSEWGYYLAVKNGKKRSTTSNHSTFCLDGEIVIYTADGGSSLRYAYCKDPSNMAASMIDNWLLSGGEFGLEGDDCIYGLTIEDDTLRLFTSERMAEPAVMIEIPMSVIRERMNLTTSETLPATEPSVPFVAGDFSGNGVLDVADVVSMTRYLVGSKVVADADTRQRMDLVPDGVIDVYDLAKLKWLVLHQI